MKYSEIKTGNDLKNLVSNWVDKFNFIQLEVIEKQAENCLFEYITQPTPDYKEFLSNYSLDEEYSTYLKEDGLENTEETIKEFCEQNNSFDQWNDEQTDSNYPMWNTLFEFKYSESNEVLKAAENAGFGIIEGLEPFNTILFVSGCGYSFYGAHWIPLYLNLPWNSELKTYVEKNKIEYSNQ